MVQFCGDVETVGFPVQNVYKMAYGDENVTFEPVNGYNNRELYLILSILLYSNYQHHILVHFLPRYTGYGIFPLQNLYKLILKSFGLSVL